MKAKLKRSSQLGSLALDMARLKASGHREHSLELRKQLIQRLGYLHGLPQKFAQLLSLSELQTEQGDFTELTEYNTTMDFNVVVSEIENTLHLPLSQVFSELEPKGISASLGQVHRGRLHDGTQVAVKVQYPAIREFVELDLKTLKWLLAPVGGFKKGFALKAYQQEIKTMLELELNYRHEVAMLQQFGERLKGWPAFHVPRVFSAYSTASVLTMQWLPGESFQIVKTWNESQKQQTTELLLRFFLASCLEWGQIHGDPHPGNYRFWLNGQQEPQIGLLDFGCVKTLSPHMQASLKQLLTDLCQEQLSAHSAFNYYLAMGFNPTYLSPLQDKLVAVSQALFYPFIQNQPFSVAEWRLGERVADILGEDRWNFRLAAPADLLFFLRTYQGLVQYLKALNQPIHSRVWMEPYLPKSTQTVHSISPPKQNDTFLRIRLEENGEVKVALKYQAKMVAHLDDLIPLEVEKKLQATQIDLAALSKRALAAELAPMTLLEWHDGSQTLRLWIA